MKKILYIAPSPPNHLNRIRSLNLLKALQCQAEIHLVCLIQDEGDYAYLEEHRNLCAETTVFRQPRWRSNLQCAFGMLRQSPLRTSYCSNSGLHDYLSHLDSSSYDLIYITPLRMAQYARYFPPEKVWVDLTDSMSLYYQRIRRLGVPNFEKLIALYEGKYFRLFEKKILQQYKTIYCSKVDLDYAHSQVSAPGHTSIVIPNVVDLNDFPLSSRPDQSSSFRLCYWGILSSPFNYTAIEILVNDIFPRLREKSPDFTLEIIGPNPPRHLLDTNTEGIIFTGYVQDLMSKLSQMDLFVCPLLLGTGVKNKILQSIACGLPILTTAIGAEGIEGIEELAKRKQLVIENDIGRYPELIMDLSRRSRSADTGEMRRFIEQNYSIEALRRFLSEKVL
jgi:polysaccharide biosynthesis protein PslH